MPTRQRDTGLARPRIASWTSLAARFAGLATLLAGLVVLGATAWAVPPPLLILALVLLAAAVAAAVYCGISALTPGAPRRAPRSPAG